MASGAVTQMNHKQIEEDLRSRLDAQNRKEELFREHMKTIRVAVFNAPYPGLTQREIYDTFEAQGIPSRTISIVLDGMVRNDVAVVIGKRNSSNHSYYVAPFSESTDEEGRTITREEDTSRVRRVFSPELKDQIWLKTDGHCAYCGIPLLPFTNFTIDHVQPFSDGGSDSYDNLVAACKTCNSRKHAMPVETFRHRSGGGVFWIEKNGGVLR